MHALQQVVFLAAIASVTACKARVRIVTETKQVSDRAVVTLTIDPPAAGIAHFSGSKAFEKVGDITVPSNGRVEVEVPLEGVPSKKQTIEVTFTGKGRGLAASYSGTSTFTFEREAPSVRLKFVAAPKDGAFDVSCQGELCDSGTRLPITSEALLSVKLNDCSGCAVEIGGKSLDVEEDGQKVTFDLTRAIADASADGVDSLGYLKIPVKITPKDGEAPEPPMLELLGSVPTAIVLGRVSKGPVAFAKDKEITTPRAAIIVRADAKYGVVTRAGDAKRIRDFDLVGVATATEKSLGSCGIYKKESSGEKVNVAHKGVTLDVTMYERRTGKSLGKRAFAPEDRGCADKLVADSITSLPDDAKVATWAKSFLH